MAGKKSAENNGKMFITIVGIVVALIMVVVVVAAVFAIKGGSAAEETVEQVETVSDVEPIATDFVEINIADYGTITAELYGNIAPITVENFMKLVDEGFYDGLTFHRIISGFMIQGGDPLGNGMGGSDQQIKGEFKVNGVPNNIAHVRGVLSMARSMENDSASSQFFIMHADAPHLDGQYAAFGRVLSGIEVVDAICEKTPVVDNNGRVLPESQPVITSIVRIDKPEE